MKSSPLRLLLLLVLILLHSSCGGGGGGGVATFTVGGTVSGLNGTVVLQNNGGDDLTITADGAFTFATKIASSSAYLVTVLTQPTGQTCTASNNSGTMGAANVADVSVVCSVNTYSVGGTVSGLAGTVVLQNNSGDDLSISANGSFTFGTAVADGGGYSVIVKTQPTGQTCTASNNTGTITGAAVTNVSVVCSANSYTIGGSITGLISSGLVLRNNGTDDLSVAASSTSFTFSTKVAHGAGYAVTIKTQPSGQVCTVTSEAGTATANVTNVSITCTSAVFGPRYSAAPNWNDYVKSANTTTACDGTETGGYSACIHGGERKALSVPGKTTCAGLTATDALGAFDWTCDSSTNPVQMISTGLKSGKYLSDLIDFTTTPAWKQNSVTVYDGATVYLTSFSSVWWTNPVMVDNDGGSLNVSGTIYTVTTSTALPAAFTIDTSKVALVSKPGVTITGPGSSSNIISADGSVTPKPFCWIEAKINVSGDSLGIYLTYIRFAVLRNVTASNASAGGGIALLESHNNKLSDVTTSYESSGGMSLNASSNNTIENVTASYNGQPGIWLSSSSNNSFSTVTTVGNYHSGVYLVSSSSNTFALVTASSNTGAATGVGVYLKTASNNNALLDVTASFNNSVGIALDSSSNNTLANITASKNRNNGVSLSSANSNRLSGIKTANNSVGINITGSSYNRLDGITSVNNNQTGVRLGFSSNGNSLVNSNASNHSGAGILLDNSSNNNTFAELTVSNNTTAGIYVYSTPYSNLFAAITAVSNGGSGVYFDNTIYNTIANANLSNNVYGLSFSAASNNRVVDLVAAHFGDTGVFLTSTSDNNAFSGLFMVESNESYRDCLVTTTTPTVTNPGLDDDADPSDVATDSFHDNLCMPQGLSSFVTTTNISLTSSFTGKVYFDNTNGSDTETMVSYPTDITAFDWLKFDNVFRGWGKNGTLGSNSSRDIWTSGYGAIWDWSLTSTDTVVRNVISLPTGSDTLTHRWTGAAANSVDCDNLVPDSVYNTDHCETTFLKNAIEVMNDNIGNDNTLCESGENCLYTPNIGSYQGHGNLISAGEITTGTITGVNLMKYETNGR